MVRVTLLRDRGQRRCPSGTGPDALGGSNIEQGSGAPGPETSGGGAAAVAAAAAGGAAAVAVPVLVAVQ